MWKRKELKAKARFAIKRNHIAYIAVCFLMIFFANEYAGTIQVISEYDSQNVVNLKYDTDQKVKIVKEIEKECGGEEAFKKASDAEIKEAVEDVSAKYEINNPQTVMAWANLYKDRGEAALNFKELTFFSNIDGKSNYGYVNEISDWIGSKEVKIKNLVDEKEAQVAEYFDAMTSQHTSKFRFVNAVTRVLSHKVTWSVIVSLLSSILSLLVYLFISCPLIIGERRFFLESRTYKNTRIGRMGFLFREWNFHPVKVMLIRDIYLILWAFTVVGVFIKYYEYQMIPYILAENPNIKTKEAFKLSKQMMKGNKWRSFVINLSFLPWDIIPYLVAGLICLVFSISRFEAKIIGYAIYAILMVFYVNAYRTATKTELYIALRRNAILNKFECYEQLNDKYLDLDLLEEQMGRVNNCRGEAGLQQ